VVEKLELMGHPEHVADPATDSCPTGQAVQTAGWPVAPPPVCLKLALHVQTVEALLVKTFTLRLQSAFGSVHWHEPPPEAVVSPTLQVVQVAAPGREKLAGLVEQGVQVAAPSMFEKVPAAHFVHVEPVCE
jgi:hypothetical protein